MKNKKIVVIGGGTGIFRVLSGLSKYKHDVTAIVSMSDNGGSTGTLMEEFGTLPAGDIRQALVAMASVDKKLLSKLFNYRFKNGNGLCGHNFGNIFLTALERVTGSFSTAIKEASRLLNVTGNVVPVTLNHTTLFAKLENGKIITGETNIDIPKHDGNLKIKKVFLKPKPLANKDALLAIHSADVIVIGPGDLYTSLIPNFLVSGISKAIIFSKAKKIYVCNLMTKFGETHGFRASDFLNAIESYIDAKVINYFIVNTEKPARSRLKLYDKERAEFVDIDYDKLNLRNIKLVKARLVKHGLFIRHDQNKLASIINKIINC